MSSPYVRSEPTDSLPQHATHWMERVDVARGPLLRSGDAQDYWGCDEQAGHRGPSRWGLLPTALPPTRTNPGACRAAPLAIGGWSRQARSLLFAPKVHFLNTVLSRECPLRLFAPGRFDSPARHALDETCCSGLGTSRIAQDVSKTTGDATRRPDTAAQAAGDSLGPLYHSHGQIRTAPPGR